MGLRDIAIVAHQVAEKNRRDSRTAILDAKEADARKKLYAEILRIIGHSVNLFDITVERDHPRGPMPSIEIEGITFTLRSWQYQASKPYRSLAAIVDGKCGKVESLASLGALLAREAEPCDAELIAHDINWDRVDKQEEISR